MSSVFPPQPPDPVLAAWLDGAARPWYGAIIWRLWLDRVGARKLLADLMAHTVPVRVAGVVDAKGVWIYLWPTADSNQRLGWLLSSYDGATIISMDQIHDGAIWACGRALAGLLGFRTEQEVRR